jgi:membrane-associated protease RseP (regulator of RpoE activity)
MEPREISVVEELLPVKGYREEGGSFIVYVDPGGRDLEEAFRGVYRALTPLGYTPLLYSDEGLPAIRLIPLKKTSRKRLPLILSAATVATVAATGYDLSYSFRQGAGITPSLRAMTWDIVLFTFFFMGMLFLHEMGHWLASRRSGVPVTLPYFIPAPPPRLGFIGTFGALISMKSLPPSMDELAYIGLAGPLSGFIAAIPITILGIHLSSWLPASEVHRMAAAGQVSTLSFAPLIFALLTALMAPGRDYYLVMHPVAFAGFIVFFVTFLNLLPIGQLDGGHVLRSVTSMETHRWIGFATVIAMILLSKFMPVLLFFAIIALLLSGLGGGRHPGSMNLFSKPTHRAWIAFVVYLALLMLTAPVPSY